MLILLSSLYMIYGFLFLYSYVKDIGLLRYLYAKKNINTLLTIELIFIIVASFVVFTSQPMNWMVGLIMIFHIFGVVFLSETPARRGSRRDHQNARKSYFLKFEILSISDPPATSESRRWPKKHIFCF